MIGRQRVRIGSLISMVFAPRTAAKLLPAYRVAGRALTPALQSISHTVHRTDYGSPFSDGACVGYLPGFLIKSVACPRIAILECAVIMISVVEELLLASGIYEGNF